MVADGQRQWPHEYLNLMIFVQSVSLAARSIKSAALSSFLLLGVDSAI